jgi:K+ transporter
MITPAISVLSAVEGLEIIAPTVFKPYVRADHRGDPHRLFFIQSKRHRRRWVRSSVRSW